MQVQTHDRGVVEITRDGVIAEDFDSKEKNYDKHIKGILKHIKGILDELQTQQAEAQPQPPVSSRCIFSHAAKSGVLTIRTTAWTIIGPLPKDSWHRWKQRQDWRCLKFAEKHVRSYFIYQPNTERFRGGIQLMDVVSGLQPKHAWNFFGGGGVSLQGYCYPPETNEGEWESYALDNVSHYSATQYDRILSSETLQEAHYFTMVMEGKSQVLGNKDSADLVPKVIVKSGYKNEEMKESSSASISLTHHSVYDFGQYIEQYMTGENVLDSDVTKRLFAKVNGAPVVTAMPGMIAAGKFNHLHLNYHSNGSPFYNDVAKTLEPESHVLLIYLRMAGSGTCTLGMRDRGMETEETFNIHNGCAIILKMDESKERHLIVEGGQIWVEMVFRVVNNELMYKPEEEITPLKYPQNSETPENVKKIVGGDGTYFSVQRNLSGQFEAAATVIMKRENKQEQEEKEIDSLMHCLPSSSDEQSSAAEAEAAEAAAASAAAAEPAAAAAEPAAARRSAATAITAAIWQHRQPRELWFPRRHAVFSYGSWGWSARCLLPQRHDDVAAPSHARHGCMRSGARDARWRFLPCNEGARAARLLRRCHSWRGCGRRIWLTSSAGLV